MALLRLPPAGPGVISGVADGEDAGVVCLPGTGLLLVQSVDYITPVVDDPHTFGAIAAANALSDLFAMGATPVAALSLLGFPAERMEASVAAAILQGAAETAMQAGAPLVGGHTVDDREVKFGLAVTGIVAPDQLIRRSGARPGDQLVLTKPIGAGVVSTAIKAGEATEADAAELGTVLSQLNRHVAAMRAGGVHACTDVTGFGLAGHAGLMAADSEVGIEIWWSHVPLLRGAREFAARAELVPGGTLHNATWAEGFLRCDPRLDEAARVLVCDAMTSGGLLMAVPAAHVTELVTRLRAEGAPQANVVGQVVATHPGRVEVLP